MGIFAPNAPFIVDAMLIGESLVLFMLILAFIFARTHRGKWHHYLMLTAFLIDLLIFKPLMTIRSIDGSNGYFPWDGTAILPHLLLVVALTIIGIFSIISGFQRIVKKEGKMFLPPKGKIHRWTGKIFIIIWVASYLIGLWIFITTWT